MSNKKLFECVGGNKFKLNGKKRLNEERNDDIILGIKHNVDMVIDGVLLPDVSIIIDGVNIDMWGAEGDGFNDPRIEAGFDIVHIDMKLDWKNMDMNFDDMYDEYIPAMKKLKELFGEDVDNNNDNNKIYNLISDKKFDKWLENKVDDELKDYYSPY